MHQIIEPLPEVLAAANVSADLIDAVTESGFYMRGWVDPFSGRTWQSVSDMMYGNKQFSSSFKVEEFIAYLRGQFAFPELPAFQCYEATSIADIQAILADPRRTHYIDEGSLTFRGQPREYKFKRKIPSPVRADRDGSEISTLPGAYRQIGESYSFANAHREQRSLQWLLGKLEPNNQDVFLDQSFAYDIMRTEQHYATQTTGLDLAFEVDTALFFGTHQFKWTSDGKAYYEPIETGEHAGVIYCFRFRDPPVKETRYLIKDFDLFKTYPPLRILRQDCGLPLVGPHERNIALTDIDCIIQLTPSFSLPDSFKKKPEFMFPAASEDKFYRRLLELKEENPQLLETVVEYRWARS